MAVPEMLAVFVRRPLLDVDFLFRDDLADDVPFG
jgi:hypothetical protein